MRRVTLLLIVVLALGAAERGALHAQFGVSAPVRYRLTFPAPEHRWMQVEATFPDVAQPTLELRMSRSSPGRYSLHDFAKNVYDVHAFDSEGREVKPTRPDPYGWNVNGHGGAVTVKYKVYGDRVDGTYLAIDTTHAHINMPAALFWARGFDDRPATVTFEEPAGMRWQVATQLHRGSTPLEFTAPNLAYLMDSPAEFGAIALRQFTVAGRTFRVALHHQGTDAQLDAFVKDVEKIVRHQGAIYGEYPEYEGGAYTFLIDYLPYASGDGMEHRNSTVITSAARSGLGDILDTVAHEFFHGWNVERIRPKGLEPFDFDRANLSDSLWLAEGFTQYYGLLTLQRAGLQSVESTARSLTVLVDTVVASPARAVRSAADMSRMAPFIDGGRTIDRTNHATTVISYYTFGGAIAAALDLSLRDRTDGRVSLDDFMRAMWRRHGKPARREGLVDRPYTIADVEAALGEVSGDRAFALDFVAKYIEGHDVADYARLLARAGFTLQPRSTRAWLGDLRLDSRGGSRVATLVAPTWPIYAAGIDQDDELRELDGHKIGGESDMAAVLQRHKPGDRIAVSFVERGGRARTATITLAADPHVEIVPADSPTDAQKTFRDRWLGSPGR